MKSAIILVATAVVMAVVLTACSGGTNKQKTADTSAATMMNHSGMSGQVMSSVKYTCTMHPEVISDTPDKCPKCGMTLVKMSNKMMDSSMKNMPMDSMKH